MYTVKCDGEWLYNPTLNYQLTKPKLTRADNSAGSFEFTMHKDHPMYDRIEEITSRVYVYRDGVEIWEGRPFKETDDWYGSRTVYCEGALAYLNDTIQEQAEYHDNSVKTWLTTLINKHNAKVDASRQFKIGNITVEDNLYRYTNFETTLDAINDKLISRLGGHLRVRKSNGVNYLDYLKDYPYSSTQKIEFGRNLLDYSRNFDLADIATVIIPLGARLEESPIEALEAYTTVESVNGGSLYVQNDTAVKNFGWICKAVHWDDVTIPSNLLTKAEKYLTDFQYDEMSLEVKAVDFHMVDSKIEALELLDRVEVVSAPHGLDKLFPISKMEIVLNDPASTTLTLGDLDTSTSSLTSKNNESNKQLLQKIEEIPTESAILKEAKEQATELITSGALGSYVIILPDEIIVTNNLNYTAKTAHVWRWNKNGLGYSSTGYNGTFGTAMTADGAIVADRITTGTMYADRIKGGTLTLGGKGNSSGVLEVLDATGTRIGKWDNTGADITGNLVLTRQGRRSGSKITMQCGLFSVIDKVGALEQSGPISMNSSVDYYGIKLGSTGEAYNETLYLIPVGRSASAYGSGPFRSASSLASTGRLYVASGMDGYFSSSSRIRLEESGAYFYGPSGLGWLQIANSSTRLAGPKDTSQASQPELYLQTGKFYDRTYSGAFIDNLIARKEIHTRTIDLATSFGDLYAPIIKHQSVDAYGSGHYYGEWDRGNFTTMGNLTASGTKNREVSTDDYGKRLLYSYETPSPLFGDVGEGIIADDGKVYIWIDGIFAETVTLKQYQVFLQKYGEGDCWVDEKTSTYFIVKGTPGLSFGWEIKAKQSDFDQLRLETHNKPVVLENEINYIELLEEHIEKLAQERTPAL